MENATKALLIAAGVLIGIMVLSLGVSLYISLGGYVDTTKEQLEANEIAKFNTQFLNYNNTIIDASGNEIIDPNYGLRIQDVVTAANIAYENNKQLGDINGEANENNLYVAVNVKYNGSQQLDNIQQTINSQGDSVWNSSKLLSEDTGYIYTCKTVSIKISNKTGRVYQINFE